MDIHKLVAYNIKRIRTEKEIKQIVLAKKLGLTVPTLSNIENGKTDPKLSQLAKIAQILNVGITDLLCNEEAQMPKQDKLTLANSMLKAFDYGNILEDLRHHNMELHTQYQAILRKLNELCEKPAQPATSKKN